MSAAPFRVVRQRDTFHPGGVHERTLTGRAQEQVTLNGPDLKVAALADLYARTWPDATKRVVGAGVGTLRVTLLRTL